MHVLVYRDVDYAYFYLIANQGHPISSNVSPPSVFTGMSAVRYRKQYPFNTSNKLCHLVTDILTAVSASPYTGSTTLGLFGPVKTTPQGKQPRPVSLARRFQV